MLQWLVPQCDADVAHTHGTHVTIKVYDNSTKTEVTDYTKQVDLDNMYIILTAESGRTCQYNLVAGQVEGD